MAVAMSGFNLDNYVDVPTRLNMALKKYPDLRIQETAREIIEMPDKSCFIRCTVTVWRDANDPLPAIASACEIYPGRTPYTKMSENEVGYTSALGRALGYMGFGINKSIASRNEVEAAQSRQPIGQLAPVVPMHNVEVPFPDEPQREYATPKQMGMMRALANGQGLKGDDLKTFISATLGREVLTSGELTKRDISKVIDALKASELNK
jgi:hypothetical protein